MDMRIRVLKSTYLLIPLVFLCQRVYSQEIKLETTKAVVFKTSNLRNKGYLVSNDWEKVPVNHLQGEDMNSSLFGQPYYPLYSVPEKDIKENRLTIANQTLDIWVTLNNESDQYFMIKSVNLRVLSTYGLPEDIEYGEWRDTETRINSYSPTLVLQNNQSSYSHEATQFIQVKPGNISKPSDNTFIIKIKNSESNPFKNEIVSFSIDFVLVNIKSPQDSLVVNSDKDYFLGFFK